MEEGKQSAPRFKAKASRRPFLFWWQAFFVLSVTVLLWSQLPLTAVRFEARKLPPLPEAHAAYVVLDPHYAAHAFKKSLTAWTSGGASERLSPGLEIGGFDLGNARQPPEYLEQGRRYPGVWQPWTVAPLGVSLPDVFVASATASENVSTNLPHQGMRIELGKMLRESSFTFPVLNKELPERMGHCRFYVETESDGTVVHLLLLTPRTPSAAAFELMLFRGHASGAARGSVDLYWMFPKS